MCIGMRVGMCTERHIGMCADMRIGMHIDMCIDTCVDMREDMRIGHVHIPPLSLVMHSIEAAAQRWICV